MKRTSHGTILTKAKAPVIETTTASSGSNPHREAGFCHAQILGKVRLRSPDMVSGGMGLPVRMAARLLACVSTSRPPAAIETANGGFLVTPAGAKTMHHTPTVASASARSTTHTPTTSEAQAFAVLQAASDATMARLYLHKGNLPAARRKAVQFLKALQLLEVQT